MSVTIGSNIVSLRAQRALSSTEDKVAKVYERLSSGLRINRASDDAAGLAIADSLKTDSKIYAQGIKNANDGLSMLSIAEGALRNLSGIITRITELAEQSANGVYSSKQRSKLAAEADALKKEYNRIVGSTTFNGRSILTDPQDVLFQVGKDGQTTSQLTVITKLTSQVVGDGTFQAETVTPFAGYSAGLISADVNGDGILDMIGNNSGGANDISVALGNGNGTFRAALSFQGGTLSYYPEFKVGDFNGDGMADIAVDGTYDNSINILLGNGNGTFKARISFIYKPLPGTETNLQLEVADFNNDGALDFAVMNGEAPLSLGVFLGNGNGTFRAPISTTTDIYNMATGDVNGDGIMDIVASQYYSPTSRVLLGNGNGTFALGPTFSTPGGSRGVNVIDVNGDGKLDMVSYGLSTSKFNVAFGNGDGTFATGISYSAQNGSGFTRLNVGDINGDGAPDVIIADTQSGGSVDVYLNNGQGGFTASTSYASSVLAGSAGGAIALGDYNGDGAIDIASGGDTVNGFGVLLGNPVDSATIAGIDISTRTQALSALDATKIISRNLATAAGKFGAYQSRLQVAAANLSSIMENSLSAESQIRDADVATESAEMARIKILQQAGVAVLRQANLQPSLALQLLADI